MTKDDAMIGNGLKIKLLKGVVIFKMAAVLFLLLSVFIGLSLSADNSTEGEPVPAIIKTLLTCFYFKGNYNNGQEMEGTESVGVFSGLDFASIANKVLIIVSINEVTHHSTVSINV